MSIGFKTQAPPSAWTINEPWQNTAFNERVTANRVQRFGYRPTYGISSLRSVSGSTGDGSFGVEGGLIKLSSSTSGSTAYISTKERGDYFVGGEGECGVAVRLGAEPSGNQDVKWGYFDGNNGLGFGWDGTGPYTFRLTSGSYTKAYQTNWNQDKLDGTGKSGVTLDATNGNVYHINFIWYGFGAVDYKVLTRDVDKPGETLTLANTYIPTLSASIEDPNQPIRVEITNGENSPLDCYIGGRQYSVIGNQGAITERKFSTIESTYTMTAAQNVWENIIAIRLKDTLGPEGRANTVRAIFDSVSLGASQPIEYKVVTNVTTSGATYGTPEEVPATETGCEVALVSDSSFTYSGPNATAIDRGFIGLAAQGNTLTAASSKDFQNLETVITNADELVLAVRRTTNNATVITAQLDWAERW